MTRSTRILLATALCVAIGTLVSSRPAHADVSIGFSVGNRYHHDHHDHHAHHDHALHDYYAYRSYRSQLNRARIYNYHYSTPYPSVPVRSYYVTPYSTYYRSLGYGAGYVPVPRSPCYRRYPY